MLAASMRSSTSPGPGVGVGRSISSAPGPGRVLASARMVPAPMVAVIDEEYRERVRRSC